MHAILCPGSRSAPLTLAFTSHGKIACKTISDERSAAFVALGMAQQTKLPTVLVCTSGSAAYNFAPAVAEAFFQQIPLLILTADRPTEWIDQLDGQTIRQQHIYGQHVKKSLQLPEDYTHPDAVWHIHRSVNEAIHSATSFPLGPVHINVPLREPLYPAAGEKITFSKSVRAIKTETASATIAPEQQKMLNQTLAKYSKVMVLAGQGDAEEPLLKSAEKFCRTHHAALVGDVISNFHSSDATIRLSDVFLAQCGDSIQKSLAPELLITFGKSIISKNLKLFLRKHRPKEHWHVQSAGEVADTFQSLTKIFRVDAKTFFDELSIAKAAGFEGQKKENYTHLWQAEEDRTIRSSASFFSQSSIGELSLVHQILAHLPARCNLHLANSMAVRYANMVGLQAKQRGVHVFCNRGTSGIDGCSSTAVGHCLSSDVPNILITGDLAFFYDRNAFWHNYPLPNLHIAVINNHGGVIFGMIDGPAALPQSAEYFVTEQKLNAQKLAEEFGFEYLLLDAPKKIKNALRDFTDFTGTSKILEIASHQQIAKESFSNFKSIIKKGYDT